MPTLPTTTREIPVLAAPKEEKVARVLKMFGSAASFNVTGHPALSVPTPQSDGLPVGRHFDDATVRRMGRAYEQLVGGFPMASAAHATLFAQATLAGPQ